MIATPANTAMTSSVPANMAQMADRLVAHHMKRDASQAHRPAVAIIRIPARIRSPSRLTLSFNAQHMIREGQGAALSSQPAHLRCSEVAGHDMLCAPRECVR